MVDVPIAVGFSIDNTVLLGIAGLLITSITISIKIFSDKIVQSVNKKNEEAIAEQNRKIDAMNTSLTKVSASQDTSQSMLQTTLQLLGTSNQKLNDAIVIVTRDYAEQKGRVSEAVRQTDKKLDFLYNKIFPNSSDKDGKIT